jgi:hypothetical protein
MRIPNDYSVMQKADEYNIRIFNDTKPRMLLNPHSSAKAVLGAVNKNLINISKKVIPGFVHGLDCHGLEDLFSEAI